MTRSLVAEEATFHCIEMVRMHEKSWKKFTATYKNLTLNSEHIFYRWWQNIAKEQTWKDSKVLHLKNKILPGRRGCSSWWLPFIVSLICKQLVNGTPSSAIPENTVMMLAIVEIILDEVTRVNLWQQCNTIVQVDIGTFGCLLTFQSNLMKASIYQWHELSPKQTLISFWVYKAIIIITLSYY